MREKEPTEEELKQLKQQISERYGVSITDCDYLVGVNRVQKDMYNPYDDHISILYKDGTLKDITEASEILNIELLSKKYANITYLINVSNKKIPIFAQIIINKRQYKWNSLRNKYRNLYKVVLKVTKT